MSNKIRKQMLARLAAIGVTQKKIDAATCPHCGHIHLNEQGQESWANDMGWRACASCGAV